MSFKNLTANDITTTMVQLYEAIPLSASIISGTYDDENIKNYTHGMFQSVSDYPYLSSSANHIFDITMGYHATSFLSSSTNTVQQAKKIDIFNEMSLMTLGVTGSQNAIRIPERDLTLDQTGSMRNLFFINFSRLITKDQIKPGTFSIKLHTGSWNTPEAGSLVTITDASASITQGTMNTQGGNYGVLYTDTPIVDGLLGASAYNVGVIFYDSGVVMLTSSIFTPGAEAAGSTSKAWDINNRNLQESLTGSSISGNCDAFRRRLVDLSFNNTTEINSTIYFCRANHNDFNYSSNPTNCSASQIRTKRVPSDQPVTYCTTVGLYGSNNELLAVAKLSEPLRKDPTTELTLRVRLDY